MTSYHIVGVGGAGMSAIAHLLLDQGHHVSGCDLQDNALTGELAARGARIDHGHSPLHLEGADIAVISSAIRADHPEVVAAHERGMPVLKRADLWHRWSENKPTLAIAGTHGKTTTTAMAALILSRLGYDPAFIVPAGGPVPGLPRFARWGEGPFVIEADEYDRLLLGLLPEVAVITSVDWDHVDIYPSRADVEATFAQFARQVRRTVIACDEDEGVRRVRVAVSTSAERAVDDAVFGKAQWQSYGFGPGAGWQICDVMTSGMETHWTLQLPEDGTGATPRKIEARLQVPGRHNVLNAVAAVAAVAQFGVQPEQALEVLADFRGAARRFEWKGEAGGVTFVDDYAHNPAKVAATLQAARARYGNRRLVVYFQPHTFSRTEKLLGPLAEAFDEADVVLVGDIYPARERGEDFPGV
ncbi:MAG TPA: UDP-N-acetylmuramate--L-alanine ligase, partial [Herpetosiphonaceae bacterium]|nr:UDP-N-acetylmuramate--L-alanine ligase [Herpetosiphonaceae bacterium]